MSNFKSASTLRNSVHP